MSDEVVQDNFSLASHAWGPILLPDQEQVAITAIAAVIFPTYMLAGKVADRFGVVSELMAVLNLKCFAFRWGFWDRKSVV